MGRFIRMASTSFAISILFNFVYTMGITKLSHKPIPIHILFQTVTTLVVVLIYGILDDFFPKHKFSYLIQPYILLLLAGFTGYYYVLTIVRNPQNFASYEIEFFGSFASVILVFLLKRMEMVSIVNSLGFYGVLELIFETTNRQSKSFPYSTVADLRLTFYKLLGYILAFIYAYWFKLNISAVRSANAYLLEYLIFLIGGEIIILQGASFREKYKEALKKMNNVVAH